jgi:hypothetical protein
MAFGSNRSNCCRTAAVASPTANRGALAVYPRRAPTGEPDQLVDVLAPRLSVTDHDA